MQNINKLGNLLRTAIMVLALVTTPLTALAAAVVDINRADAATMIENWKGIGEKKAKAIVAYRKKNGNFSDIDDLKNVDGIGDGIIKNNRKYMSVTKGVFKPTGKKSSTTKSSTTKSSTKESTSSKSSKSSSSKSKTDKSKSSKSTSSKSTAKKSGKKKDSKSKTKKSSKSDCKSGSKSKDCKKKSTKKSKKKKKASTT